MLVACRRLYRLLRPIDVTGLIKGYMLETQLYCEAKLHYTITSSREPRVSEGEARRLVEETLRLLRTPRGSGVEVVRGSITASYNGIYITVSPDALIYVDGVIAGVLEARIRASMRYYDSDFIVQGVTGLLLEELLGVELSNLKLLLVIASDDNSLREALKDTMLNPLKPGRGSSWARVVRVYDRVEVESRLSRLLEYWLGLRGFKPNPTRSKCGVCEYKSVCPYKVVG